MRLLTNLGSFPCIHTFEGGQRPLQLIPGKIYTFHGDRIQFESSDEQYFPNDIYQIRLL